jgi:hypothetical protein
VNNEQAAKKKKRHIRKRTGHPELHRVGEDHSLIQTVNKQATKEGRSGGPRPATLEWGKLVTVTVVWKDPPWGEGHFPMQTINKQAGQRRRVWHHLPQCAWRGEGIQQWLKFGTLHQRLGAGHFPTWTLNKKGLQWQQAGGAVYWRKQKGHASRSTQNKPSLWG